MDQLQILRDKLHEAQRWCDHNGDHNTGRVSITVETLQQWENEVIDIINELDLLLTTFETEVPYANTKLDI